ncbi:Glycosyl transferase, family 1 [Metarhizium rileyi]|uniref:Glycosyl transferase, family 1 n=1 Tax=Metarhizium rileyi (strain RCEF 4871) TaxID=1649241 RepID=A0A167ELW9_METRR|nr:Glycosyl transferase, family 1 [Metarhizium rileyi RCEF 4871]
MTSFFQPGSNDPAITECGKSTFAIYCNSALPTERLLREWYQKATLAVSASSLLIPIVLCLILLHRQSWFSRTLSHLRERLRRKQSESKTTEQSSKLVSFESTRSFKVYSVLKHFENVPVQRNYDLAIFPLTIGELSGDDEWDGASVSGTACHEATNLAYVNLEDMDPAALQPLAIVETTNYLVHSCIRNNLAGLALRPSSLLPAGQVEELIQRLHHYEVSVLLLCHHDSADVDSLSFQYSAGIILENACILPNGQRRDYFQAKRLRDLMIKCATERSRNPGFFVGFLEIWENRPHPSVVRRAVKLAEHFGAVVEHGYADPNVKLERSVQDATRTLSGIEYLRRGDVIELQKSWSSELRAVDIPGVPDTMAACRQDNDSSTGLRAGLVRSLSLAKVDKAMSLASRLLHHEPIPNWLETLQEDRFAVAQPPSYLHAAPKRTDFWRYSAEGTELSPAGCFSILAEPSSQDYATVVETQCHLRELQLLHSLKGAEVHRLIKSVQALLSQQTKCLDLLNDFIAGLETSTVLVFKGLDTGFKVPDGNAYFWGVSAARDETHQTIDIYISQSAPNDAAAALHTWLAHHGVSRATCLELEGQLQGLNKTRDGNALPLSIRRAMEAGTYAELLQLLQQIRVANLEDRWRIPLASFCESILTSRTSKSSWSQLHARGILDGSMSVQDMLRCRLESYVVAGATRLPLLENLVEMYDMMSTSIRDSLFYGDREQLNALTSALVDVFDPGTVPEVTEYIDVNADLFALMFFTVLRKEAFEEVYIESTDRCPIFLCADQAAVFSELWVLGSQCEIFLGLLPRDLGDIIYDRYQGFLSTRPPVAADRTGNEIMTMYSTLEAGPAASSSTSTDKNAELSTYGKLQLWKKRAAAVGAVSIFSLPAIVDVLLLTFLGRGLFMTAFMDPEHLEAAAYALLISLLLTAGVTGWVGSTGSYYLNHYAYDNMTHFHVQRLSGGFMLTLLVAICGLVGFSIARSITTGLVFVAFVIVVTTYLNLLGVMATMHQQGSPMTSGRTVLWRTIPLLLISPIVTSFVNGRDLAIYLPISYLTILLLLYQYRQLCQEWNGWMKKIPSITEKDVVKWYESRTGSSSHSNKAENSDNQSKMAQEELREAIVAYGRRSRADTATDVRNDGFVKLVASGMPYIDWLFKKTNPDGNLPETFSSAWYTQLGESKKQQEQLSRGLKEHDVLMLFRDAKYDLGQNLGLFLIALMDRWVGIIMSAREPHRSIYVDSRARYAICFCILYFLIAVVVLDMTLQKYWTLRFTLSKDKLADFHHAQAVAGQWERIRRQKMVMALVELLSKLLLLFGLMTLAMWFLVDNPETILLYYLYILGYTGVVLFQCNRCFTTNVHVHVYIILGSAIIGLVVGCVLHASAKTAGLLYSDVIAQNVAALLAAFGTLLWTWKDWLAPSATTSAYHYVRGKGEFYGQRKIQAEYEIENETSIRGVVKSSGPHFRHGDGSFLSQKIDQLLTESLEMPNFTSRNCVWSHKLLAAAFRAWTGCEIDIVVVDRESFVKSGLQHLFSFSQLENDVMTITVGFLGEYELRLQSWQSQLAQMVAESVLYHAARAVCGLTHSQAVHAEHFLQQTTVICKRIEFELALADAQGLRRIISRTNSELLRRLSLDLDVDLNWQTLPSSVREAIICRIAGRDIKLSYEFKQWQSDKDLDIQTVDFHIQLCLQIFRLCEQQYNTAMSLGNKIGFEASRPHAELRPVTILSNASGGFIRCLFRRGIAFPVTITRWVAVISGGGSNIERELSYSLQGFYFRRPLIWICLLLWKLCWAARNLWIYYLLVCHRPAVVKIIRLTQKGALRSIKKNAIVVEMSRKTVTGFATHGEEGNLVLEVFEGCLGEAPEDKPPLFKATYDGKLRLVSRVDREGTVSTYNYDSQSRRTIPTYREVVGSSSRSLGIYDKQGRLESGTLTLNSKALAFFYHYKSAPKNSTDLLRADFQYLDGSSNDKLSVFWGKPLSGGAEYYNWAPSEMIHRIIRVVGGKTYVTEIEYHHRRDPKTMTYLEEDGVYKSVVVVAPKVFPGEESLLCRPRFLLFDEDDLLIRHSARQVNMMRQYASHNVSIVSRLDSLVRWNRSVHLPVATWRSRTELWSAWLKGNLDVVTACWIDEMILREEPLLRRYWRARDSGRIEAAREALEANIDQIVAAIELETDVSELCQLPIRSADLYTMGLGKDANQVTNRPQDCYSDTKDRVSVIVNDVGCWPEAPGGVSNCRRDLVNGHSTVRNHVMAECANEFGIPRFQIEKNVQSLKLLPLWGLDGKTANHGLIDNILQSEVDANIHDTDTQRDITLVFVPLLKAFVKGARTKDYTRATLVTCTNAMLSMSKYFESKDYNTTWSSKQVQDAWVEAWLVSYPDPNIRDASEYFDIARPTLFDFREALGIYIAYFFIFSVRIPDECPRVFQSTHHGISSLLGIILKYRRGVTFGIWDHAILWRESCLNISPAQCELPLSVQSMLLHGIRLASRLSYFHADVITPCTSLFNPMWETEIGSDRGNICNRNLFNRKIDPIVNGISNMDSFEPVDKVRTEKPTAVMLSNVQFIKGIKTAILAADIIVNRYGFKDYRLMIYGAKDRQPSYALEMAKLIVKNNLSENVILAGFGKPKEVLKDAWIFMNSSISEGLPLAIGEAALAGVPIVATEVGATALVMTDPDDAEQRYGEVVAPNDPAALARAQLNILCMVGPWAKFVEDKSEPTQALPEEITRHDVEWLYKRMYAKTDDRRKLGLLSREVVLQSFHGKRYLREHEQMYWIQWHTARMRADTGVSRNGRTYTEFSSPPPMRYIDEGIANAKEAAGDESADSFQNSVWEENTIYTEKMASRPDDLEAQEVEKQKALWRSTPDIVHTGELHFAGQAAASGFTNWAPG